jgi:hypothetical protein
MAATRRVSSEAGAAWVGSRAGARPGARIIAPPQAASRMQSIGRSRPGKLTRDVLLPSAATHTSSKRQRVDGGLSRELTRWRFEQVGARAQPKREAL